MVEAHEVTLDFPRGGAPILTPLEVRKIKQTAEKDVLFKDPGEKPKKIKKKSLKIGEIVKHKENSGSKIVDKFSFKYLVKEILILGYVKEFTKNEVVVGLPNGLNGYIPMKELQHFLSAFENNDEYIDKENEIEDISVIAVQSLIAVGQLIPVKVMELNAANYGYKKIILSTLPINVNNQLKFSHISANMLLWGYVKSVEDHGAIISLGNNQQMKFGFLPKDDDHNDALKVGMLKWLIVKSKMKETQGIKFSSDEKLIQSKLVINSKKDVKFSAIFPGQYVEISIDEWTDNGLCGKIFGSFNVVVELVHVQNELKYDGKKFLPGRVIYTNPTTKQIGVSLLEKTVKFSFDLTKTFYDIGSFVENCKVTRYNQYEGIHVDMSNDCRGFVHISRINDEAIDKLPKQYNVGSKHKCRILGYSALDECYTLTLKQADLNATFLRYEDVKPGQVVDGEIVAFENFGVIVKLTKHIKGLCPLVHLSDITFTDIKRTAKKFAVGKKIKCKVLNVNINTKQLTLTHKKTLLKSEYPIITEYNEAKIGVKSHGFVSKIVASGLIISFYNHVTAILSRKEVGDSIKDYYVGQVLLVTIKHVNSAVSKMVVTLKGDLSSVIMDERLQYGELHDGKLVEVNGENITLDISKHAVLPIAHLSDYVRLNICWDAILSTLPNDYQFKDLRSMGLDKKLKKVVFSKKWILKDNSANVKSFTDLKPHMVLPGVITNILSYGIFVEVAPGTTGLSPNNFIQDFICRDPSKIFHIGQSVIVKVLEHMDVEKKRFTVTLKPSLLLKHRDNPHNALYCDTQLTSVYLEQRNELLNAALSSIDKVTSSLPLIIDNVILGKAISQDKNGMHVHYEYDGFKLDGLIQGSASEIGEFSAGDNVQCFVVNINLKEKLFYGVLTEEIISGVLKRRKKKEKKIEVPQKSHGILLYIDNDIAIFCLPELNYVLSYMSPRKHLNHMIMKQPFTLGSKVHLELLKLSTFGIIVKHIDETIAIGSMVSGFVKSVKPAQLSIDLTCSRIYGRVHITQIVDIIEEGVSPLTKFKVKQKINAKILGFREMKTHNYLPITHMHSGKYYAELSLKSSVINSDDVEKDTEYVAKDWKAFQIGDEVNCFTITACNKCIYVAVNASVKAKIPILNLSAELEEVQSLMNKVKPGYPFTTTVVDVEKDKGVLILSRIGNPSDIVKKGNIVVGRVVKKIKHLGLFVQLPNLKAGIVHLTEICDTYIEDALDQFEENQFVRCYILDITKNKIDLSLRLSRTSKLKLTEDHDRSICSYNDIREGDIIRGYVKAGTKVGVFVGIGPGIDARVQIKNLSQYFVKDYLSFFTVGKLVKGKVRGIDPLTNQIDFSLRGSDVGGADPIPPQERFSKSDRKRDKSEISNDDDDNRESPAKKKGLLDFQVDILENKSDSESENNAESMNVSSAEEMEADENGNDMEKIPRLKLSGKFDWNCNEMKSKNDPLSSSDDSDLDIDKSKDAKALAKKTKRQKRAAKKAEEESLREVESMILDNERPLESAADFDRMVLSSPNSSIVWIQYMAFHLHSSEVDRARNVAKKAIKTISFREEQEKLNVWVALLNLEATYGSKVILEETFREAVKFNEPKKVYMKMADIYAKDSKYDEDALILFKEMLKKFKSSKQVWISYCWYLMKNDKKEEARNVLSRSVKSLSEKKSVDVTVKFAVLEYKFGEAQRGCTIFETLLKHYPKRIDIWSVYIDMTIKQQDLEQVRNIFERVTALNLSTKKMKFFFKRYIAFEEQYGNSNSVNKVRGKAMEYVESRFIDN